jgi:PAS domain S-box-containing protein
VSDASTEKRLRLIIDSSPVSLVVVGPEGTVLAANRCALDAFAAQRLDQVVGHPFDRLVAPEHRANAVDFVAAVCKGTSGSLEYDLVDENGTRRTMETRAVPLRREGTEPAVFLGATWEMTEGKRQGALITDHFAGEREALQQAVQDARQAAEATARSRESERQMFGNAIRENRYRMQMALAKAEEQHQELQRERAVEREALLDKLKGAEMRVASLETDIAVLTEECARNEEQLRDCRASRANLEGSLRELEDRCSRLTQDQARWQGSLFEVARLLQETSMRAAGLLAPLDEPGSATVSFRAVADNSDLQIPDSDSEATSSQEGSWQF